MSKLYGSNWFLTPDSTGLRFDDGRGDENLLERQMAVDLSDSKLFDYPTLEKLRDFMLTDAMAVKVVNTATAADARFASDGVSADLLEEIETLIASG